MEFESSLPIFSLACSFSSFLSLYFFLIFKIFLLFTFYFLEADFMLICFCVPSNVVFISEMSFHLFIIHSYALSPHFWIFLILTYIVLLHLVSFLNVLAHFEISYSFDLSLSFWYAFIIRSDVILFFILFYLTITLHRTWLRYFSAAHFYVKSDFWNFRGLVQDGFSNFREFPLLLFSRTSVPEIVKAWFRGALLTQKLHSSVVSPRLPRLFHYFCSPVPLLYVFFFFLSLLGLFYSILITFQQCLLITGLLPEREACPGRKLKSARFLWGLQPRERALFALAYYWIG